MRDYIARHCVVDYDVVSVRDGVEALEHLRARRPSIVLADVMMPRMDGLALVREIRSDPACAISRWCCFRRGPAWRPARSACSRVPTTMSSSRSSRGSFERVWRPTWSGHGSRSRDAAWLRAILGAIQEPFVVVDRTGLVVQVNDVFTRTFGWSLADGPLIPPYPWWIPESDSPDEHAQHQRRMGQLQSGRPVEDDRYRILRRGGGEAWVHVRSASVPGTAEYDGFIIVVLRDETREQESRRRRELAARIAVDLATAATSTRSSPPRSRASPCSSTAR